jgi:hypothetical protein
LGDLKRTWREGKTGLLAHLSEVSRITVALAGVSMSTTDGIRVLRLARIVGTF